MVVAVKGTNTWRKGRYMYQRPHPIHEVDIDGSAYHGPDGSMHCPTDQVLDAFGHHRRRGEVKETDGGCLL